MNMYSSKWANLRFVFPLHQAVINRWEKKPWLPTSRLVDNEMGRNNTSSRESDTYNKVHFFTETKGKSFKKWDDVLLQQDNHPRFFFFLSSPPHYPTQLHLHSYLTPSHSYTSPSAWHFGRKMKWRFTESKKGTRNRKTLLKTFKVIKSDCRSTVKNKKERHMQGYVEMETQCIHICITLIHSYIQFLCQEKIHFSKRKTLSLPL